MTDIKIFCPLALIDLWGNISCQSQNHFYRPKPPINGVWGGVNDVEGEEYKEVVRSFVTHDPILLVDGNT